MPWGACHLGYIAQQEPLAYSILLESLPNGGIDFV